MIEPYYDQDGITIYNEDCAKVLPWIDPVDLLLTDPPYGIDITKSHRLCKERGFTDDGWDKVTPPKWMIDLAISKAKNAIVWGGNYFELAPDRCFLVWHKLNDGRDFADCELAWTNLGKVARCHQERPQNMDHGKGKVHPTQKPIALMHWCIDQAPDDVQTILDPFMGSGTTLVAARNKGKRAIGIEREEKYCRIAVERLAQKTIFF